MTFAAEDQSDQSLAARLERVIVRLGLDGRSNLFRSLHEFDQTSSRYLVRQAFDVMGMYAVFGFGPAGQETLGKFTPILYLAVVDTDAAGVDLHRLAWSQGVVPLLLVASPEGLQVRQTLAPPPKIPILVPWSRLEDAELPDELTSLTAVALRSSIVWRDFAMDRGSRVDKALLSGIIGLSTAISESQPNLPKNVIHAVIGRFLYFYVLLDRKVIDIKWIRQLTTSDGSTPLCPAIADYLAHDNLAQITWPAEQVWALFDAIDAVMNGAIFPVEAEHRAKIDAKTLHDIHRVIRHADQIGSGVRQTSFLDVSFATLRTETVSAIYELFIALESKDTQSQDGAFYTPPYLVDYVLDEVDRIEPLTKNSRVLDPSAGSGIFLVGSLRRILERSLPFGRMTRRYYKVARKLLEDNIHGIERNVQAANVCRFSLYLTLLDYLDGCDIRTLRKFAGDDKVFPPLNKNIASRDVFSTNLDDVADGAKKFTHVVGNPPWGSYGDAASRTNVKPTESERVKIEASMVAAIQYSASLDGKRYPISNKRLSELFIWKIKQDFLAPSGTLGILISTRSFVSRTAEEFPNAMAREFKLVGIANLSHFRYRLFAEARSPTIAIFARNEVSDPMDTVWVFSPLLSSQPIGQKGHIWSVVANDSDIERHRLRDLVRTKDGWFGHLVLRPLDRRYANHLRVWTAYKKGSLGHFFERNGMRMTRGGSPAQTGLPEELLLKANYKDVLGNGGLFDDYPYHKVAAAIERNEVKAGYVGLFQGPRLLIPRTMNDFIPLSKPAGASSTFNIVVFDKEPAEGVGASLFGAMARYLLSDVARYFFALIGRTWILDHARLEKSDLEAVPFPFSGPDDDVLPRIFVGTEDEITAIVMERMGFDKAFANVVSEYTRFRNGYEDSQLPSAGLNAPDETERERYKFMLKEQLVEALGSKALGQVHLVDEDSDDYFDYLSITVARPPELTSDLTPVRQAGDGQFNPFASIISSADNDMVHIRKPRTKIAWTMEQAYADARSVWSTLLRSGAQS